MFFRINQIVTILQYGLFGSLHPIFGELCSWFPISKCKEISLIYLSLTPSKQLDNWICHLIFHQRTRKYNKTIIKIRPGTRAFYTSPHILPLHFWNGGSFRKRRHEGWGHIPFSKNCPLELIFSGRKTRKPVFLCFHTPP